MQHMREWSWSPAEKRIAREAFEEALRAEKESAIREFQDRVARIRQIDDIDDLWALEGWLHNRRKGIDEKYDYRYSVLPDVFARLIVEGRVDESDLAGLNEQKRGEIHRIVGLLRSWTAESKSRRGQGQA